MTANTASPRATPPRLCLTDPAVLSGGWVAGVVCVVVLEAPLGGDKVPRVVGVAGGEVVVTSVEIDEDSAVAGGGLDLVFVLDTAGGGAAELAVSGVEADGGASELVLVAGGVAVVETVTLVVEVVDSVVVAGVEAGGTAEDAGGA